MSGYEACQKIREITTEGMGGGIQELLHIDKKYMENENKLIDTSLSIFAASKPVRPYILALSALITSEVKNKCLDCGFDDVRK